MFAMEGEDLQQQERDEQNIQDADDPQVQRGGVEVEDLQQEERDEQNIQDADDPHVQRGDVEVGDWLEEEDDEQDEEMELEAVFLFVEDVIKYCLMYSNVEWEAPDHRYEERFYANRATYFSVIIGQAVVHHCLKDFCVQQTMHNTDFDFDQWTRWPLYHDRHTARYLINEFMGSLPMAENRRGIATLCIGFILCERAMNRHQPLLVDVVVQEIVFAMYLHSPFENYFLEFSGRSYGYVTRHRQLHRRSRDEGFFEGPIDVRELLD